MNFQSCGGFHYKFMALSTSSFAPRRVFERDPPKFPIAPAGKR